jgi:hypothetical protein
LLFVHGLSPLVVADEKVDKSAAETTTNSPKKRLSLHDGRERTEWRYYRGLIFFRGRFLLLSKRQSWLKKGKLMLCSKITSPFEQSSLEIRLNNQHRTIKRRGYF